MTQQSPEKKQQLFQTKTYVRGTYLYSTDDGAAYEQKNKDRPQDQLIIDDKAYLGTLKKQIQQKKQEIIKKKQKARKQKGQLLIPIRDTPVQPLPQPSMDNNKCQRATQQQFQYFQTFISQKQKQRKFYEEQKRKIQIFQKQQQRFNKNQQNQERKGVSIVFEKQNNEDKVKNTTLKKKPLIKVLIKKKSSANQINKADKNNEINQIQQNKKLNGVNEQQNLDQLKKVRVVQEKQ